MSAVAAKPRAVRRSPPAVKKPTAAPQAYYPLAVEASALLTAAWQRDEALNHGDTLRFTRIAMTKLESLPPDPVAAGWDEGNLSEALFDAEALIRAAASTATDTISPERWALLDRAFLLVDTAVSTLPEWEGLVPSGLGSQPRAGEGVDADRQEVIRMASAEIIDWVSLIGLARDHESFDAEIIQRRIPQLLSRIEELGSIVLSGVGDEMETTESLEARLDGWTRQ